MKYEEGVSTMRDDCETWEPVGGHYYVNTYGYIVEGLDSHRPSREFGTERPTRVRAESMVNKMRAFNRLLAYIDEHNSNIDVTMDVAASVGENCVTVRLRHVDAEVMGNLVADLKSGKVNL